MDIRVRRSDANVEVGVTPVIVERSVAVAISGLVFWIGVVQGEAKVRNHFLY